MANWTNSGYLSAAVSVSFTGTQTINSLTDNEWTDLSDVISNGSNKYVYADLQLDLGSAAFTGTDAGIEVFLVPCVDGTNYPTWTGNVTTDQQEQNLFYVGFMPLKAATQAQRAVLMNVELPNGDFKLGLRNRGNVTLAGSGNALVYRPHTESQ